MTKPAHATQQTGAQAELFATPSAMPEGFHYRPDLIDQTEQQRLVAAMARLWLNGSLQLKRLRSSSTPSFPGCKSPVAVTIGKRLGVGHPIIATSR